MLSVRCSIYISREAMDQIEDIRHDLTKSKKKPVSISKAIEHCILKSKYNPSCIECPMLKFIGGNSPDTWIFKKIQEGLKQNAI